MTQYTDSLRLAKQATAENDKVWGSVTNAQIDNADAAIAGATTINVTAADVVLSALNGAADQARNMTILVTGAPAGARNVIVPRVQKVYTVHNACGQLITVKTSTGAGLAIADGARYTVFVDDTNNRVYGLVQSTAAAVLAGPAAMTTIATAVALATAGTANPPYYSYQEGGQVVIGTNGFTVTVNSGAFFVNGAFPVSLDLDTTTLWIDDGGTLREALVTLSPGAVIYSRADTVGWTTPSSRIVPRHFFTVRAP